MAWSLAGGERVSVHLRGGTSILEEKKQGGIFEYPVICNTSIFL